jgi:hypothetical protein
LGIVIAMMMACATVSREYSTPVSQTAEPSASPRTTPDVPSRAPANGHALKTVFIIVMENHNWSSIQGNPSAPYINHTLLPRASYALRYYNPPGNHPSEPNYLWLEAGSNLGITNDDPPQFNLMEIIPGRYQRLNLSSDSHTRLRTQAQSHGLFRRRHQRQ